MNEKNDLTRLRIGNGFDVHPFAENRKCMIGGVDIPYEKGLQGHSDADVLLHALIDALLGAAGLEDIGTQFPDSDSKYKGADSCELLQKVIKKLSQKGFTLINADCTILAEEPKMKRYIPAMKANIASICEVPPEKIGIKATTTESLGTIGRKEGIAAFATVLLYAK